MQDVKKETQRRKGAKDKGSKAYKNKSRDMKLYYLTYVLFKIQHPGFFKNLKLRLCAFAFLFIRIPYYRIQQPIKFPCLYANSKYSN